MLRLMHIYDSISVCYFYNEKCFRHLMKSRVSMLLKSRTSPDVLPFSLYNKKRLEIRHMDRPPLSNDTIDSVLPHRELGRAKDFISTASYILCWTPGTLLDRGGWELPSLCGITYYVT